MVKIEDAVAVAVVVDDQAGVGDARGDIPHHHASGGQIEEIDGPGLVRLDRNVKVRQIGDKAKNVRTACLDDCGRCGRLWRQHAERFWQHLRAPHQGDPQMRHLRSHVRLLSRAVLFSRVCP